MRIHSPSRREFLGMMGIAGLWPGMGAAGTLDTLEGSAFGTKWRVTAAPNANLELLSPHLAGLFAEIDLEMSPWRPDSSITRFNTGRAGSHPATGELVHVTEAALRLAEESGGAFDPTVGPLVARWGFGPILDGGGPDWRALSIGNGVIGKRKADVTLDLCGIAKGRALDRAADLARSLGFDDLLMDLGGEIKALGRHPSGRSWQVAVEHPFSNEVPATVLGLPDDKSVATSGVAAQGYSAGGRVWGHIIDPRLATPVEGQLRSVSVIAQDAMTADGWATALFAAGDVNGPILAEDKGIDALFLFEDETGLRQALTGRMAEYMV